MNCWHCGPYYYLTFQGDEMIAHELYNMVTSFICFNCGTYYEAYWPKINDSHPEEEPESKKPNLRLIKTEESDNGDDV